MILKRFFKDSSCVFSKKTKKIIITLKIACAIYNMLVSACFYKTICQLAKRYNYFITEIISFLIMNNRIEALNVELSKIVLKTLH